MNLLLKLLSSPSLWVDIALSMTGGLLVYWGLFIEKKAEKLIPPSDFKPDLFEDIISKQKAEIDRGWKILMAGIILEVVAAFGISVISGLEIADLGEKTARANERAAIAESNSLVLRSNVVALEATVQWRTITAEQETNLINLLKPAAQSLTNGQKSVLVRAEGANNPETKRYANRIINVLKNCGFEAYAERVLRVGTADSGLIEGVLLQVKDRTNPPPHAIPIINAFRGLEIKSFQAIEDQASPEGVVVIWVLPKPEN